MPTLPLSPVNPLPLVIWKGLSGAAYEFQNDPIGTAYRRRPGVYIFAKRIGETQWQAVYVGQTDDFSRRIADELTTHESWQRIRAAGATHICTLHVPGGTTNRLAIETDLRHALNPPCNRQ